MNKQEYNMEQAKEWANLIPINDLFAEIKKLTGLTDLTFTTKIIDSRNNDYPHIEFESQDLVDKIGFLKLMFSSICISNFNSVIKYKTTMDRDAIDKKRYIEDKEYYNQVLDEYYSNGYFTYWGTASFSYKHPGGGHNSATFLTFWFDDYSGWKFDYR